MNTPLTLHWDNMHIQSRKEAVLSAGFRIGIAKRKPSDIEQWIKDTIINHELKRSNGKMTISFNPKGGE